ncbi:uncharacterized protein DUF3180 [Stackebrandtia albiflava]|uniref:Uncharacterized protein DUF3180 n=1 Tax=Stackebrandtia albiflava TaxID=406432 RepID=A0A562UYS8_9ACTN|nr:DUF3180 domain-containing protein [Stackebrandtia albiflava]TWJ10708.1 uncharacterized protein DUF3180 [Stackebrandtia albiflava]
MPEQRKPKPSLTPTTPSTLFVTALAAGAVTLLIATRFYERLPAMSWLTPVLLLALAVVIGLLARNTKARIERRPGSGPVEPLTVARYAALAKACAVGGALLAGAYAGLVVYTVAQQRLTAAQADLPVVAFGFVVCLVLVAAALWLERACRVPPQEDDDSDPPTE